MVDAKKREYLRNYYDKNKKVITKQHQEYRKTHREKINAYHRDYYKKHTKRILQIVKKSNKKRKGKK